MSNAQIATRQHIARVRDLLGMFATGMVMRGEIHDASKFDPIEMGPLEAMQEVIDRDGPAPFGSEEYKRRTAMLGPMIEHHRAHNSHHPEHYGESGVAGMDLFDLVEMFFDWRAANLDRDSGAPMALSYSIQKYNIPPMLASILRNTAARLGYSVE